MFNISISSQEIKSTKDQFYHSKFKTSFKKNGLKKI